MKLIDAKGKRKGITVQKYFAELFPNGKIKGVPLNLPIYPLGKLIRNVGNIILSSRPYRRRQIIKLGMNWLKNIIYRIGYLLKKGKDKPSDQVIINIDKVIIKG